MKNIISKALIIFILLYVCTISSCKKEEAPKIIKEKITGQVQKGPFINGTNITMSELNESLAQTGNVFTTQIINNSGSFKIDNISLTSSYVEFNASGYYFDEVKGDLSIAPLNLFALSDIRDISTVNVNIMTHLEKQRVGYLIKQNKTFAEAKKTAQTEILGIFGFSISGLSNSESLDISVNSESNAILLAISVILQGNRSVGDLTELLANISNDLKDDGNVNNTGIISDLRASAKDLKTASIRTNLEKRYQDLGISAIIPGFEKYVNDFLAFTGEKPSATTLQPIDVTTSGAKFNGTVNPNSLITTVVFEYGKTSSYGDSIAAEESPVTSISAVNINKTVTTLLPGTTYHFRVKARNSKGTTYGEDLIFTTLGKVPSITTLPATNLSTTSATLNASVNANLVSTTVMFKWGKTSFYSDSILATPNPVTGNSAVNVSADITGLTLSSTYYVKAYATNSVGKITGNEINFTIYPANIPTLAATKAATAVTSTTATSGGNITSSGGATVTSRGVCWSTAENPTIELGTKTSDGTGTGIFTSSITGLTVSTTYYVRAYATNIAGTSYGTQIKFFTVKDGQIADIDGNVYNSVAIGTQVWMKENLKTTRYNNEDLISTTPPATLSVESEITPKYQWAPDGNETKVETYGRFYTWYSAVDSRGVCPTGWHVPSDAEWTTMENYLIANGYNYDGSTDVNKIAKALAATSLWTFTGSVGSIGNTDFPSFRNKSGFTALPTGCRLGDGTFSSLGFVTGWWSTTEFSSVRVWYRFLLADWSYVSRIYERKDYGFSVRCLKDN